MCESASWMIRPSTYGMALLFPSLGRADGPKPQTEAPSLPQRGPAAPFAGLIEGGAEGIGSDEVAWCLASRAVDGGAGLVRKARDSSIVLAGPPRSSDHGGGSGSAGRRRHVPDGTARGRGVVRRLRHSLGRGDGKA